MPTCPKIPYWILQSWTETQYALKAKLNPFDRVDPGLISSGLVYYGEDFFKHQN